MPSLINAQPLGLLSTLGIKSVGQNPTILPDVVQPTIELLDLYAFGQGQQLVGGTGSTSTPGYYAIWGIVPAGQAWYVNYAAAQSNGNIAAASSIRCALCVFSPTLAQPIYVEPFQSFVTGEQLNVSLSRPVLVRAGYALGLCVAAVAGTSPAILSLTDYVPLAT